MGSVMSAFSRHPDVTAAARVGEPSLQDQDLVSAKYLLEQTNKVLAGQAAEHSVSVTQVKSFPKENQPAPTSENPNPQTAVADTNAAQSRQPDPNELTPNTTAGTQQSAPDPNELTPNVPKDAQPAQAPPAVNEIAQSGANGGGANAGSNSSQSSGQDLATDEQIASSKHKKKKGILQKIVPGK